MPDGRLLPVRCCSPNKCDHCAMLVGIENALVVRLDAENGPPTAGITLTTHDPAFDLDRFRDCVAMLFRWLRDEYGREIEYLGFLEWTTGTSVASRGRRYPHQHALIKNMADVPADLEAQVSLRWERWTGGAWRVEVRELRTPAGAVAYLAQHHHKREQAPPPGFRGRRLRPSKGYYSEPIADLRSRAKTLAKERSVVSAVKRTFDFEDLVIDQGMPEAVFDDLLSEAIETALANEGPVAELMKVKTRRVINDSTGEVHDVLVEVLGPAR